MCLRCDTGAANRAVPTEASRIEAVAVADAVAVAVAVAVVVAVAAIAAVGDEHV